MASCRCLIHELRTAVPRRPLYHRHSRRMGHQTGKTCTSSRKLFLTRKTFAPLSTKAFREDRSLRDDEAIAVPTALAGQMCKRRIAPGYRSCKTRLAHCQGTEGE